MSDRMLIGSAIPGGTYLATYVHNGLPPADLIPRLRTMRAETFTNTAALEGVLIQRTWSSLDPTAKGPHSTPGVGYPYAGRSPLYDGRIGEPFDPEFVWLYLLDWSTETVSVYSNTGDLLSKHRLVQDTAPASQS